MKKFLDLRKKNEPTKRKKLPIIFFEVQEVKSLA
jgi:hypothetical protein